MTDFQSIIRERIAELEDLAESSREATATVELDQTRQGRLSRMDALQGQAMAKDAERRRGEQIRRLKAAWGRLERGEFGECLECGEAIARPDCAPIRPQRCASTVPANASVVEASSYYRNRRRNQR